MKLRNISKSAYEFTVVKENDKGVKVPFTFSVQPGAEIEIEKGHPESMKKLAEHYPKDWVEISEKKKTAAELKAELKQREEEEKAAADAAKKADADAKKAEADAKKKEKEEAEAKKKADEEAAQAAAAKQ